MTNGVKENSAASSYLPGPIASPASVEVRDERRRRASRSQCSVGIRLAWTCGFDKYAMGACVDISRTGLRMLISHPIPVGTKVSFKSDCLALGGSGTVRFCKRQTSKYMIGLDFAGGLQWRPAQT